MGASSSSSSSTLSSNAASTSIVQPAKINTKNSNQEEDDFILKKNNIRNLNDYKTAFNNKKNYFTNPTVQNAKFRNEMICFKPQQNSYYDQTSEWHNQSSKLKSTFNNNNQFNTISSTDYKNFKQSYSNYQEKNNNHIYINKTPSLLNDELKTASENQLKMKKSNQLFKIGNSTALLNSNDTENDQFEKNSQKKAMTKSLVLFDNNNFNEKNENDATKDSSICRTFLKHSLLTDTNKTASVSSTSNETRNLTNLINKKNLINEFMNIEKSQTENLFYSNNQTRSRPNGINYSSSGCSSGASSANLSRRISQIIHYPNTNKSTPSSPPTTNRSNVSHENLLNDDPNRNNKKYLKLHKFPSALSPFITTRSVLSASAILTHTDEITNYNNNSNICSTPMDCMSPKTHLRNFSYLNGLNDENSKIKLNINQDALLQSESNSFSSLVMNKINATKTGTTVSTNSSSSTTTSSSSSSSNYLESTKRGLNRRGFNKAKSESMFVEKPITIPITFLSDNFSNQDEKLKNLKDPSKDKQTKKKSKKSKSQQRDSGILADIFHIGSMNNLKTKLNNATASLRNSFSVFSLKSANNLSNTELANSKILSKNTKKEKLKKKTSTISSSFSSCASSSSSNQNKSISLSQIVKNKIKTTKNKNKESSCHYRVSKSIQENDNCDSFGEEDDTDDNNHDELENFSVEDKKKERYSEIRKEVIQIEDINEQNDSNLKSQTKSIDINSTQNNQNINSSTQSIKKNLTNSRAIHISICENLIQQNNLIEKLENDYKELNGDTNLIRLASRPVYKTNEAFEFEKNIGKVNLRRTTTFHSTNTKENNKKIEFFRTDNTRANEFGSVTNLIHEKMLEHEMEIKKNAAENLINRRYNSNQYTSQVIFPCQCCNGSDILKKQNISSSQVLTKKNKNNSRSFNESQELLNRECNSFKIKNENHYKLIERKDFLESIKNKKNDNLSTTNSLCENNAIINDASSAKLKNYGSLFMSTESNKTPKSSLSTSLVSSNSSVLFCNSSKLVNSKTTGFKTIEQTGHLDKNLQSSQKSSIVNVSQNKPSTSAMPTHNHQKIVVQASTSDLLSCFAIFISHRCSHLIKDTYINPLAHMNSDIGKKIRFDSRDTINWLRSADRALLIQGWQDIAFMNPVNVVFVYLLVRETLKPEEIKCVYDLQCNIMACLYLAFSYMGNEISYPLKPFLIEENRDIFWQRTVTLMNKLSSHMLRINRDPRYFTELFYELKSFSNLKPNPQIQKPCKALTSIPITNTSSSSSLSTSSITTFKNSSKNYSRKYLNSDFEQLKFNQINDDENKNSNADDSLSYKNFVHSTHKISSSTSTNDFSQTNLQQERSQGEQQNFYNYFSNSNNNEQTRLKQNIYTPNERPTIAAYCI